MTSPRKMVFLETVHFDYPSGRETMQFALDEQGVLWSRIPGRTEWRQEQDQLPPHEPYVLDRDKGGSK